MSLENNSTKPRTTHSDEFNIFIQKQINRAVRCVKYNMRQEIDYYKEKLKWKKTIIENLLPHVDAKRVPSCMPVKGTDLYIRAKNINGTLDLTRIRVGDDLLCGKSIEEYLEFESRQKQELREKELREKELREKELREQELREQERREQERREQERSEQESREQERREQERREQERRREQETREQERPNRERLENQRREQKRKEQERREIEQKRLEQELFEQKPGKHQIRKQERRREQQSREPVPREQNHRESEAIKGKNPYQHRIEQHNHKPQNQNCPHSLIPIKKAGRQTLYSINRPFIQKT